MPKVIDRQANAAFAVASNEAEPAALRFCGHQDALDFASRGLKEVNRRFSLCGFRLAKS